MTLLLIIANITGAGMIVPQVARLHRTRSLAGVSSQWIGVGIAMNTWWVAYGLAQSLWGVLPVSGLGIALYLTMAIQVIRLDPTTIRTVAVGAAGIGLIPLTALTVAGWPGAGLAIGLCYGVQFAPAMVEALTARDLSGVSAPTWWMAWIEAAIWLVYGLTIGDIALIVGGGGGAIMSTAILARLVTVRPRRRYAW